MSFGAAAISDWPADGLEAVTACPACMSADREPLHDGLTDRTYLAAPGRWRLFRCTSCGSAYLDPRPNDETVHLAFSTYYTGAKVAPAPERLRTVRRFRHALRNGYLNARYGYGLRPASRLGRLLVPLLPHHRLRADEAVRHLRRPPGRPRLLDVGCGDGEFLVRMQGCGWEVEGLEPNADAVRLTREQGIDVREGTLDEAALPRSSFDAITFRLVLEYVRDPASGLAASRDALKPGGLLWIASPNLASTAHRLFGRDWIFLDVPRQSVLFTPTSLVGLVTRVGFEPLALHPSPNARWSFRLSAAIARGLPPFRRPPPLAPRLALRARLADLQALRHLERADVVVLVARKP